MPNKREIKFRGQSVNGEWRYGLISENKEYKIAFEPGWYISNEVGKPFAYQIRPETVGQCSGLCDSEGKDVYEDDFINAGYGLGRVVFREGCFFIEWVDDKEADIEPLGWAKNNRPRTGYIVVGNIYEHPNLLHHAQ